MLEYDRNRCAICDERIPFLSICAWCWKEYKEYIQKQPQWMKEIKNYQRKEYRRRQKEFGNLSLDVWKRWELNAQG